MPLGYVRNVQLTLTWVNGAVIIRGISMNAQIVIRCLCYQMLAGCDLIVWLIAIISDSHRWLHCQAATGTIDLCHEKDTALDRIYHGPL